MKQSRDMEKGKIYILMEILTLANTAKENDMDKEFIPSKMEEGMKVLMKTTKSTESEHSNMLMEESTKVNIQQSALIHKGEWDEDKRHGQGTYRYPNGDVYEGDWRNGEKQGHGKYTYKEHATQVILGRDIRLICFSMLEIFNREKFQDKENGF